MTDSPATNIPGPDDAGLTEKPKSDHPSGKQSYGKLMQVVRGFAFIVYFATCILTIFTTQVIGLPLYVVNRDWYYAYMAMTKQHFAIVTSFMTYIWGPTKIRISGDATVAGQMRAMPGGRVEFDFPERVILVANHQIYTDWLYLWWVAYANRPRLHGHIYIILKASLRYIPFIGWGMMLYSFIFMTRKMATDQPRMAYRLWKLRQPKTSPSGKTYYDPMWLMLFPEGTNLCANGRTKSESWAKKNDIRDPEHLLLPRGTGMYFCLSELKGTVEYVYDCTIAYEGIPRGEYGEQLFGLSSTYFQGLPPKSVNLYWRRFKVSDIPLATQAEFDIWLREEWYNKDALLEEYTTTGRFPPLQDGPTQFIETEVRTKYPWEIVNIFTVLGIVGLVTNSLKKLWAARSAAPLAS
ncbi:acyltransferase-domain-containing protein [Emericellopsis atlantica]|uniref:Acyltransferase-domain-containing protein n=1 Tax=Emericellopsis atlantica TaxID=2614577 RepID=A0A9P7ZJT5_9HYPO|nr:acyltransferase-domain-containing protein [Emericellopsis atlantica]KAG9252992.1 acyltransferase-domain-containing protein [Emericellopsis atlantica]